MVKDSSNGWSSVLVGGADTIVARSSPVGRGALAVIRVSGGHTRKIAAAVCPGVDMTHGWRASLVELRGPDGGTIDQAVAVPFPAPRSYTGEDMLEITVHGAPWIVRASIEALTAAGARPAEPGEFTRRAVANGKLDLVQAEAINELANAETAWQARVARAQAAGVLSREFAELKAALSDLLAQIEAALDFGHHDIPFDADGATQRCRECLDRIRSLLATAAAGRRIRDGVRVVILGPPNSGKSTLFNLLVGRERAIVSPHAGTTRDVVEAELEIGGVPVVLTDTAGLTSTVDPVEREGIRRAEGAAADADAVIVLWPADDDRCPDIEVGDDRPVLRLRSKIDLADDGDGGSEWEPLSCRDGRGVQRLRRTLAEVVADEVVDLGGETAITERHRRSLERAAAELEEADLEAPELAAEAVRAALEAVRELLGEVVTDDLLDRIFGTFCIGK